MFIVYGIKKRIQDDEFISERVRLNNQIFGIWQIEGELQVTVAETIKVVAKKHVETL